MRIPLLFGSRLVVVTPPDDALVLRPPVPPDDPIADVVAAVRDALRFPLSGPSLEELVPRGGRATILLEVPALPVPAAAGDPRQQALAATVAELERLGIRHERMTILVTAGLARKPGRRELENLVTPHFALGFRGRVEVHDVADPELVEIGRSGPFPLRVNRALVEADAVVAVTAAETVLHGGPAALLAGGGPEPLRAAGADSLLETAGSGGWALAVAVERALAARVPLIGVSLALDHPRLGGALRGYPYEEAAVERVARSPLTRLFRVLPPPARLHALRTLRLDMTASAVFAGRPSVAHAEALLRGIETRSAELEEPLDALCLGVPSVTPYLPRERPNPLLATYLALALALRLWRDAFPVADGGTAIFLHRFHRRFAHPTQHPYRAFFQATRQSREPETLAAAEEAAATDERALGSYSAGRTCHPLLPFADWAACAPALDRLGAVIVAGCRDAAAARQLGFVPTHGVAAALEMAHGRAGGPPRIGFILAPPYFPLRVGGG